MLIENKLQLSGTDLKDATVIGYSGINGTFYHIQLKLKDGKYIDLKPSKSNARIETTETIWKPNE